MGYWKTKVLPQIKSIKKVFGIDGAKKAAALEACKPFDEAKEELSKEFEEKKAELQPKVQEIYEKSPAEIKSLVKEPKESGLKKYSVEVQTFLDQLKEIEFPGSKLASEVSSKFGPALVPGPVIFVLEKVSTFIIVEEKTREVEAPAAPAPEAETTATKETSDVAEKEIVVAGEKPKEVAAPAAHVATPAETSPAAPVATPAETAPPKEDTPKVEQPKNEDPPKKN